MLFVHYFFLSFLRIPGNNLISLSVIVNDSILILSLHLLGPTEEAQSITMALHTIYLINEPSDRKQIYHERSKKAVQSHHCASSHS